MSRTTLVSIGLVTVGVALAGSQAGTGTSYAEPGPGPAGAEVARAQVPVTAYELPFPCGEVWTGTTRAGHSPSAKSVDWNRPDDVGDPVAAAAAGTVTKARATDGGGYGRYVVVDHGNGESSLYGHLDSVAVTLGQVVSAGTVLGAVGSSGNATGPHLHFEERVGSTVVDPWFHAAAYVFGTATASQNCGAAPGQVPLAANFFGSVASELVVYRAGTASTFQVLRAGKAPKVLTFGTAADQPFVGDWDGDGRANPGVRTPRTKLFQLKVGRRITTVKLGRRLDRPVVGDWDGDGISDIGVRKAGSGLFKLRSADGTLTSVSLGDADDVPVTGDWDGDGRSDLGVYDAATATFTMRRVDAAGVVSVQQVQFGAPGDLPVTGDWDGNLTTDLGVWNPATAVLSERPLP